jgi:pimeloyl-ACP methyl ester carboxylesterase
VSETSSIADRSWAHWTVPETIEVGGVETVYRRKGTGEPLLYLHGAGLTRAWLPLYEELSKSFDVIVPEHPGFGDTAMPQWLHGVDDLVLHYDQLLDALELEDLHLVGHSLGGWIAAYMTIFYRHRFRSLSLVAPLGLRVPEAPMADPFRLSPELAMDLLLNGAPPEKYAEYFQQQDDLEDMIHAYSESITLARLLWNPRYDVKLDHRLRHVSVPTLVIAAEEDRLLPEPHPQRWAELIDGARLTTVEGDPDEPSGHLVIIQQPERLARAIAEHAGGDSAA